MSSSKRAARATRLATSALPSTSSSSRSNRSGIGRTGARRLLPPRVAIATATAIAPLSAAALDEPAEENAAQREQTQRFPEREAAQVEDVRHQPVPQQLHGNAAEQDDQHEPDEEHDTDRNLPRDGVADFPRDFLAQI